MKRNGVLSGQWFAAGFLFQFQQSKSNTQITPGAFASQGRPNERTMDKIAGLKEILAQDSKNTLARYGLAMALAAQGETDAALAEFSTLLGNDPNYTAAYFMAAQTLANGGRTPEAIERLKAGIASAKRTGNNHALSEMQAMLDEIDR